ncbi:Gfo/Idh/MocA family oxidoreductase [Roseimicrobium sp. ORNL1]|uniref:Gfo/Idh/MocA family protein n=1 Tax=Roseimicrobium sp. ORNL1 TaxID=2711231 RepID=UPI0013E12E1D|nr:Gfo/Idh/MocA family oxidoreductase [Roseimicrobium sp. ORNL1]QIF03263.1 Gfo/Idh/MocA family oxidoreductase [Roseimicrobium sp. ORNL1]
MNPNTTDTRRGFIRKSAVAAAGSFFAPNILKSQEGGGKKVNVAGIGAMGKGESDIGISAEGANIVAICDVDRDRLKQTAAKYPNAKTFDNFPEMFETMGDKIDMVTVSTPDHAHYPAAMEAIKRGKHVCVQKPLVNRIWEANQLHEAAKKKGVKTNMGNQGHTGEQIRQLKEWMNAGIIGNVKEIHVWTNRPIWPQGNDAKNKMVPGPLPKVKIGPKDAQIEKELDLNWQAWLAQTPDIPFTNGLHPFAWRGHLEYGAGAMGDMGCHIMDGPFWACELGEPYKMEAECDELTDVSWPKSSHVVLYFKHPKFGDIKLHWYEGGRKPERPAKLESSRDWSKMNGGFYIVGEEDTILNVGDYCEHLEVAGNREKLVKFFKDTPKTLERSLAPGKPQLELVKAIEQDKIAGSNFDYSVPLTKLCLFGNLAIRNPGKVINWDTAKQATGDAEVDKLLKRAAVRQGWEYSADKI